jgi:hypothetical protein
MTTRIVAALTLAIGLVVACRGGSSDSSASASARTSEPAPSLSATTHVALDSALRDLGATPFPIGQLAVSDKWHVMADSAAVPRLYLMYRVAALQLPSGPVTVTLPVTLFRFSRGSWRVLETKIATDSLPRPVVTALTPSLTDTSRTYAFLVHTIALIPDVPDLEAQIRDERDLMVRQGSILLTNGLFGAER